ncbi:thiamin biosynthesis protein [Actinotalea fermentans]|uniref:Thiamin biosynthesis protein n=1 Tax=Actinotalea fermentans TaxID=43671 RepID=A0A511YZL7_9CELL|nr:thiamin biosynthesis protein [Actinotalea fermentans]
MVLWQGPTRVRLGADPRWSVVLSDLSPSAARALATLPRGADDERSVRAAMRREEVPADEAAAVLAHLRDARLLVPSRAPDSPDAAAWGLLADDGDGAAVLARRRAATVRVSGLGRLGATVAATLAAGGVGRLELDDDTAATRHDVAPGMALGDVGGPRAAAVARALHDVAPGTQTAPVGGPVDLVVLIEHHVADPSRHRPLVTDAVPHLSVVVREASVLVGPLVRPGHTPCLRCLDLHRTDADPDWPALATQLAARRADGVETVLSAVGGALAAAQALAVLDGRTAAVEGGTLEVPLPDAVPRLARWGTHPACGCAGLPA